MSSLMKKARHTLMGDRAFYGTVLAIVVPVIIQNGISNFVNLLDNLMVGALGDAQMSGVSIANQLVFIFNLTIFGGLAGPGIFGAQFYGAGDIGGLRNTFRIKVLESLANSRICLSLEFGVRGIPDSDITSGRCGIFVYKDADDFVSLLGRIVHDAKWRGMEEQGARKYVESHYSREHFFKQVHSLICQGKGLQ